MKKVIFIALVIITCYSCSKGTKFSKIPSLKFAFISDTVLMAGKAKEIFVRFNFQDGDGDIGFNTENLFVIDSRFMTDTQNYKIPDIPEKFAPENGIEGIMQWETNGAFLKLRSDSIHLKTDTFTWFIFMKDKAKNMSNIIETSRVILKDSL